MSKIDRSQISNFMHWLGLLTALTFIFLGVFILYTDNLKGMDKTMRTLFAVFFFALGVFRTVNWFIKNKARSYGEYADDDDKLR